MRYDAIIIGAGVIGCSVSYNLAKRGFRTLNVDALPAAGYGSTSSSCAVIRVYYSTLDATAMAYEGYHDWKDWAAYLGTPDGELARFIETGTLVMKTPANGMLEHVVSNVSRLGIAWESWDAERIRTALPGYCLDSFHPAKPMTDDGFGAPTGGAITGGIFFPAGGYVDDPQLAARNLKEAAELAGGQFVFKQKVVGIPSKNNRVTGVITEDGSRYEAPVVVNVSGPHSGKVNALTGADLGIRIGTRPLRQEVVQVKPPEALGYSRSGLIVSDSDVSCYIKPGSGGHLMIGSENPPCDPPQEVDPDAFSRDLSDRALTYACRYAQRLPELGVPPHPSGIADVYDASDDWLPIYDRTDLDGYYVAIGTSGNQFKNAPVAGRLMAELIRYCEDGGDHDHTPLRLALTHLDHAIDTASFSRKRDLTKGSSFSVLG
ncbi:FAD-binding oxidoreductase [Roseibium sp. RKSG952]|uniref:NAD(P)/FAD-dependent oxidoreductase n=1 Tax=Roseibium sp. RKSG952 TaxID=2529384 RepID=UPI0012BBC0F7|nr:FAD-dependent oxidoreductase [Roseibium sp. RKSG952]MTH95209.1 FAD-binding oxidoreductase [Roseibium sp. RKSG952]